MDSQGHAVFVVKVIALVPVINDFKKMSPQERLELVKAKKLCSKSLMARNHVARWCRKKDGCDTEGCTRQHSTLLHDSMHYSTTSSDEKGAQEKGHKEDPPTVNAKS